MALEGQHIGRYHLEHLLGSGGMGEVYLATDTPVNRQVAIKVIRTEGTLYSDSQTTLDAARLFQREIKAIAGLDHPHILPLFDYGEDTVRGAKVTYMVMPLRQEGVLTTWVQQRGKRGLLSPLDVAQIVAQAASALQYAHDRQIVHQDVKPSNFLIRHNEQNPEQPYLQLSDFGVAKFTTNTSSASQSIRGTPTYMAPEQWEGNPVPASDQYALAIMAYELLAGRPPFQGGLGQTMYQHMSVPPQPPSTYNPHIPPDVDEVILRALEKKPEERFASITAFARAFQQAVQSIDAPTLLNMQHTMQMAPGLASSQNKSKSNTDPIRATLAISEEEALRGAMRTITLPDGRRLTISVPAGIRDGETLHLDSQGILAAGANTIVLRIAVQPLAKTRLSSPVNANDATILSHSSPNLSTPTVASTSPPPPPPPPQYLNNSDAVAQQPRRFPLGITLGLVALAFLVIAGGGLYFARAGLGGGNTDVPIPAHTQGPTTTSTQVATAVATSAPTTVPTTVVTQPAETNPYTHTGTLVMNDPLVDNSQGHVWLEGTNSNGAACEFTSQGYHVTQPKAGYFHACMAQATDYSNFVFEVQITMLSGDYAGLVFRNNPGSSTYYLFRVDPAGQYYFKLYDSANPAGQDLRKGNISPINFNQTYRLAVVANYANISLYIDGQQIASISDPTLTHGQIGVLVGNENNSAEAVFSNVKLWKL